MPVLPTKVETTFSKDPKVSRLVKGIFKLRPSLPKYVATSNPEIILNFIDQLPANKELMLEISRKELWTLLCLLSEQSTQSLQTSKLMTSVLSVSIYIF